MNCGSSADSSPWRTKKSISTKLQLYLNSVVSRTVSNTRRTGHSSKEWTSTLDSVLQLDFDAVVPGHGTVTTKPEMRKFRDSTLKLRTRVHDLIVQKKTRDDISKMLQSEFHWAELHLSRGLDGIIAENQ